MKKSIYKKILFLVLLQLFTIVSFAQMTAPSDPGGEPEGNGDPLGGGAPLSGGTFLLIVLGAAYGAQKTKLISFDKKKLSDKI